MFCDMTDTEIKHRSKAYEDLCSLPKLAYDITFEYREYKNFILIILPEDYYMKSSSFVLPNTYNGEKIPSRFSIQNDDKITREEICNYLDEQTRQMYVQNCNNFLNISILPMQIIRDDITFDLILYNNVIGYAILHDIEKYTEFTDYIDTHYCEKTNKLECKDIKYFEGENSDKFRFTINHKALFSDVKEYETKTKTFLCQILNSRKMKPSEGFISISYLINMYEADIKPACLI